ncbi:hypothetical protein OEZ86_002598 [Tetradesmus obliquus]|nr:hypothetical protein OEZ86_002598 [Tetradesmus obliquus]
MMKTLFTVGRYNHWRNFIKLGMVSLPVPDLEFSRVPGSTFATPGFRSSWWVTLKPELQPKSPKASLVLMYLHGGAFMAGHPLMYKPAYRLWMQQMAEQGIHVRVFAVGYPLAPEHPFPAGMHGVAEAYDWLVAQLGSSEHIILAGDSAGGNLTITGLTYMRDRAAGTVQGPAAQPAAAAAAADTSQQQQGQARPAFHPPLAAIMISPATDFTNSSVFGQGLPEQAQEQLEQQQTQRSATGSAAVGGGSTSSTEQLFHYDYISKGEGDDVIRLYLPQPHDAAGLSDPLVSPMFIANFSGLVRRELLVVTGGCEAMVPDIHRFVARVTQVSPELPA